MIEEINSLIKQCDHRRFRVANFSGIIFLCGGKMGPEEGDSLSARDFFYRQIKEKHSDIFDRIFLAEDINNWFFDMLREEYTPDLLSFEKTLSGLASAICLIVESPGSIAELGAFSALEEISDRLMVVVRGEHNSNDSFIALGPITYLKRLKPERDRVFVYPWGLTEDKNPIPDKNHLSKICKDFINDLRRFETENPKDVRFDSEIEGHITLLIGDLVDRFSALRIRELVQLLEGLGLKSEEKSIKHYLLILEKIGFVRRYEYRGSKYYVSVRENNFIEFKLKDAPPDLIDRSRFKINLLEKYRKGDQSRLLAIKKAKEECQGEIRND